MLIQPDELLDLIAEVGHELILCGDETVQSADVHYGMPVKKTLTQRRIRGYVVPEKVSLLQLVNQELKTGGYIAYVSAVDLQRDDLTARSRFAYEDTLYPLEYLQGVMHQGVLLLHKIRMIRPQQTIQQPDRVIRDR